MKSNNLINVIYCHSPRPTIDIMILVKIALESTDSGLMTLLFRFSFILLRRLSNPGCPYRGARIGGPPMQPPAGAEDH